LQIDLAVPIKIGAAVGGGMESRKARKSRRPTEPSQSASGGQMVYAAGLLATLPSSSGRLLPGGPDRYL
jgi:hypothetical protein